MDETATIKLRRASSFFGAAVRYKVLLDGLEVRRIKNGEECSISVSAGLHTLVCETSETLRFELNPGECCEIFLELVPPIAPKKLMAAYFFGGSLAYAVYWLTFHVAKIGIFSAFGAFIQWLCFFIVIGLTTFVALSHSKVHEANFGRQVHALKVISSDGPWTMSDSPLKKNCTPEWFYSAAPIFIALLCAGLVVYLRCLPRMFAAILTLSPH